MLKAPRESEVQEIRTEGILSMKRDANVVVKSARQKQRFIAVLHDWLFEFIARGLGRTYYCIIAEVCKDYSKITKLGYEVDYSIDEQGEM